MTPGPDALALGWQYFQSGHLAEAEQAYRQVVALDPGHADAWCMLGIVCRNRGNLDEAARAYRQALRARPGFVEALNNLGNVLVSQNHLDEAVATFRQVLQLRPDYAEAYNNLGVALRNQGQHAEAEDCYRRALQLKPGYADAHNNLGDALAHLGKVEQAVGCYREALRLKPNYPQAHTNLGVALARLGKPDEAAAHHLQALALWPGYPEAHLNLGNVLAQKQHRDQAIASYREALRLKPGFTDAHYNLGIALAEEARLDEAVASYREALRLKPTHAEALGNLGHALRAQGKVDEAMGCYQQLLERRPDDPEAHMTRALTWLLLGDYEQGWPEYEWRWKTKEFGGGPPFTQPRWDGEPLAGKTILLHAEQGLGDTLQFARYAAPVKQKGGTVVFRCQKPLVGLFEGLPGVDRLVPPGEAPPFDVHAPLLSLPAILGTTLATVPADVPYVFAREDLVEDWRRELEQVPGFKVGIVWQGNPSYKADRYRSIPLKEFGALAAVDGVQLVSLQKGHGTEQLRQVDFPVVDLGPRLDESTGPFLDTAAVIKDLDLVVSIESAIGHLAGALGARVWLALSACAHFVWLLGRDDSPWYPAARLFRQEKFGDWGPVFRRMAEALAGLAAAGSGGSRPPLRGRVTALLVEVAPGDLLDKTTILRIKAERIADADKLAHVRAELDGLEAVRRALPESDELAVVEAELGEVNLALWDVEDALREHERRQDFGPRFVELARSVYRHNDRRAALKREANELLGSPIVEEKSYAEP